MRKIITFIITFAFTIGVDLLWLMLAKPIYQRNIGELMIATPNFAAAFVVYLLLVAGILLFVLPKAQNQYLLALFWGMAFGAMVYGVYDFTNLAILAGWPLEISLIDMLWGAILCGTTSVFALAVTKL